MTARTAALGTWTLGVDYLGVRTPSYTSGLFIAQPAIVASDQDNTRGADLTPFVMAGSVDADIDRQGGKAQCALTVHDASKLSAWDWVRIEQTITPEVGDPVTAQLGLFRLEQPATENIGDGARDATATGVDIVTALLEQTVLTAPLTIPPEVNIMRVVRMVTELAGRPPQAANMVPNPTTFGSGWSTGNTPSFPGVWDTLTSRSYSPDGATKFTPSGGATAAGGYGYLTNNTHVDIDPGVTTLRLSLQAFTTDVNTRPVPVIDWYDATDTLIGSSVGTIDMSAPRAEWYEMHVVADVPAGATKARASARIVAQAVGAAGIAWVDEFWMGEYRPGGLTRHAYPDTARITSSYVTYPANTTLTTVINDYLAAIGHYAVSATPDGQPTSQPYRDLSSDQPARTWAVGVDSAITGTLRRERATGNLYNVVVLVKEDFTAKTSIQGVARNDDRNHPWSTWQIGEQPYTGFATISPEADQAALDAQAAEILRRASVTDSLDLTATPDPALGIHDVIAVSGADGDEDGTWGIERISWSLDPSDPLMTVTARRTTVSTGQVVEEQAA